MFSPFSSSRASPGRRSTARRLLVPVAVGEIAIGVVIGRSGFRWLDTGDPTVSLLADIGFAMLMLSAGMHVPLRQPGLRSVLRRGALAAAVAIALGVAGGLLAGLIDHGHGAIYALLLAGGSAAVVLPMLAEQGLLGCADALTVVAQVALADVVAIAALPIVLEPSQAARVAGGSVLIAALAAGFYVTTRATCEAAPGCAACVTAPSIGRGPSTCVSRCCCSGWPGSPERPVRAC